MSRSSFGSDGSLTVAGDKLQRDLANSVEELTRNLESFIKSRSEVVQKQKEALAQFELEMQAIGDFEDAGEEM
jgi:hypothetical protein